MEVLRRPCSTCPYRKDHPSGVWHEDEYEKLLCYEPQKRPDGTWTDIVLAVFLCHQSNIEATEIVCRGWLTVERESAAARLAEIIGLVTADQRYADPGVELYATGAEAAAAGLARIEAPGPAAEEKIQGLLRRGVGKRW